MFTRLYTNYDFEKENSYNKCNCIFTDNKYIIIK